MISVKFNFTLLFRTATIGVLMMTAISACSSSASPATPSATSAQSLSSTCITNPAAPLALVIGARSNAPKPNLPAFTDSLLEAAAGQGQQISIVEIDGQPKVTAAPAFSTDAGNAAASQDDLVTYLNDNYLSPLLNGTIHAQAAQANVLEALDLAASAVGADGNIVLVDSGLQTVAPLEYQDSDLLEATPSDVVTFLKAQNLLPDLSGRHVVLSGIGYTATPQPALDEAQRANLISQWEAIATASGACVTVDSTPNTAAEMPGLPQVSIVEPPAPPTFTNITSHSCGTVVLEDAGNVGFVVGKASFRDPAAAQATLAELADALKNGTEPITLIGSTSSEGGDAVNNPLSLARAKAVKAALVNLGIPAGRMTAVGDGSHWSGRVADVGSGGVLLPGPAEQDREVIVQLPKCA
jgi:outer membrane protein OmpA-like peptidoglycan-associated protein